MSAAARFAVEAARNRRTRGRFATLQFLRKRAVPLRLYQLACALQGEEV